MQCFTYTNATAIGVCIRSWIHLTCGSRHVVELSNPNEHMFELYNM
jgi:hypothetical protein